MPGKRTKLRATTAQHFAPALAPASYLFRWLVLSLSIGILAGTASAALLASLDWATTLRESHLWLIALLPIAGLATGLLYHHYGQTVQAGNNLLLEQIHNPQTTIPLRMAPLILLGTITSHLFGASAGREGTALQMGASLADQLTGPLRLPPHDRRILLMAGISASFGSVFGTPLAGAIFGLEVLAIGKVRYDALVPCLLSAIVAHRVTLLWGIHHTVYKVPFTPPGSSIGYLAAMAAGIVFGLTALLFTKSVHSLSAASKRFIPYAPLRPFAGGIIIAIAVFALGTTRYIGLGIPTIVEAFSRPIHPWDFAAKFLFTVATLGTDFKGGEVTPLFFIGTTLGNALSHFLPLPVSLLSGMGFCAVFAGAANTPVASTLMAMELFGSESAVYVAIACVLSYLFSGHSGIYSSQLAEHNKVSWPKYNQGTAMRLLLIALALLGTALAQPKPLQLQDYYGIESVSEPALSLDARQVAFTRTHIVEADNKRFSEIWLGPADGSTPPHRISDPAVSATGARWSPDGRLLAYTANGQWFLHMGGPDQVPFHIAGAAGAPVFSPDNKWIAFTRKAAPPSKPAPELSDFERVTAERFKGRIYSWMNFRFDGRGYLPDPRDENATPPTELFLVPIGGGEPKQITHAGVDVTTPTWRPDSRMLAFTANTHQRDETSYERADLWTVTLEGEAKRLTADDGWHHRSPAWSPDGRFLAVLREEGLDRVLQSKRTQAAPLDLYLIPAAGGTPRNLTPDWDDLPGAPKWSSDGRQIFFHSSVKGTSHLFRISFQSDPATSAVTITQLTQGDRVLGDASIVADRMAYTVTSSDRPVELYSAALQNGVVQAGSEKKLTAIQEPLLTRWQLGKTERIRYDSKDGTSIDGWVVLPPGYDAARTYPLILTIHGGPHGAFTSSFSFEEQLFAAAGYIVVYTNPRGSTGYGEKFQWGTWGSWGNRDLEDVLSGVDYAIKHYRVDPKRLGITGYSYGGFLTNWAIGHTDRFAAAVVGAGPSNWISNYDTGDIPRTKESEFLGHPWDAQANAVMIRQSPITYAKNIHTPTLFVHGEADARVPISQAEEMYTTLKKQGIPAKFIRYPGEYHGGWSPWDTVHRFGQELQWWQQCLGAQN